MDYEVIALHDPAKPRRFRFDIKAAKAFEKDLGCGIPELLGKGQNILTLSKLLYHGCKWDDRRLTEDQIDAELDLFIRAGGELPKLFVKVMEALNACHVFGQQAPAAPPPSEEPADPPQAA